MDISDIHSDAVIATIPVPQRTDPIFTPISQDELVKAQLADPFCVEIRRKLIDGIVVPFELHDDAILCRQVSHEQIVIPHSLKARVLHIHHYSGQAEHPGGRKLYNFIRPHMYWPALAVDCYALVRRCATCAKNRIKLRLKVNPLQLFPPSGSLESIAIDIFGDLLTTGRCNL